MDIATALKQIVAGDFLGRKDMQSVMQHIMSGEADPIQTAGFLTALSVRGETSDELAGAVMIMRSLVTPVQPKQKPLLDTCGTGGSGKKLFNVSTAAAFVAAAGGVHVSKHGNRGVSSRSGGADVLEEAGAEIALKPDEIARCVDEIGIGFMFAQAHHQAAKHVASVRAVLGIRTLFNLVGPLANPASATFHVLGVPNTKWQQPMAEVLQETGSEAALVVYCDGLDEFGLNAPSKVVELKGGKLTAYEVTPEDAGLKTQSHESLSVDSPASSLRQVRAALSGTSAIATDIVAFNAGAAFYLMGKTNSIGAGVTLARDLIASGQALEKWKEFIDFTKAVASLRGLVF